jgi:hypothetical protein
MQPFRCCIAFAFTFKFSKTGKSKYLAIVLDIWWPKFRVDCEGRDVFFEALV